MHRDLQLSPGPASAGGAAPAALRAAARRRKGRAPAATPAVAPVRQGAAAPPEAPGHQRTPSGAGPRARPQPACTPSAACPARPGATRSPPAAVPACTEHHRSETALMDDRVLQPCRIEVQNTPAVLHAPAVVNMNTAVTHRSPRKPRSSAPASSPRCPARRRGWGHAPRPPPWAR
jgi:hypothetical protein